MKTTTLITVIIFFSLFSVSCNKEDDQNTISSYDQLNQTVLDSDNMPIDVDPISNYPDPFVNETTITFSIPNSAAWTTLIVYNNLMEKVAILISDKLTSGNYNFVFDASGLPDGKYFAKLNVGSSVSFEEMIKKSIVGNNREVHIKD